ncbi:MAG TPA: UDP-N-acetylmuramate--L-alanine ligase [Actinomycetota bacterium]|nr:UDP-N-acetylmuramate--L-alanine ligase [Actinomycetota bacterium]
MFEPNSRAHFIGVGGAGMSAIAKVLVERGVRVSGSDLKRSRAATTLEAIGARITIGHSASLVDGADVVVVSRAIPATNPELRRAEELGIPVVPRGDALAAVLHGSRSIIVAGTHGKTTTSSMVATILREAGLDPTYLIGAGLNDVGSNARAGRGDLSVAESDESDGSFLQLEPFVGVVTNIELDHVDYWGDLEAVRDGFRRFAERIRPDGALVVPVEERDLADVSSIRTFGDGGDIVAEAVRPVPGGSRFDLSDGVRSFDVMLRVPGLHNIANALAAAAACAAAGLDLQTVATGLQRFTGVERRFQVRGEAGGVTVVDDYAHHPTEVRATLAAARAGEWQRVLALFQPHRYSRTAAFKEDFGSAFDDADRIVVTDVYGAGEQPVPGVTGKLIADAICEHIPGRSVAYIPHRTELVSYLEKSCRSGDVLLTLGAGDVNSVGEELLARLSR